MYIKKLWRVHNLLNPTYYWKLLAYNSFNRNHWWRKWLLFWSDCISYGIIFFVCGDLANLEQHEYSHSACCWKTDTYVLLFINDDDFTFLLCSVTNRLSKFSTKWLNNWIEYLYPWVHQDKNRQQFYGQMPRPRGLSSINKFHSGKQPIHQKRYPVCLLSIESKP